MYKVQHDVPIPPVKHTSPRKSKYPFATMEVGAMFFVPGAKRSSLGTYTSKMGKALDKTFSARACHMKKTPDGWVPAQPSDKAAVEGVGVWRTK